jgi:hypothetical protein
MFIAALFIMAKMVKCPTADEWIEKMWYTYIMEYYSFIKKNEIMSGNFTGKWTELEIMLSEISHDQKDRYDMFLDV